MRGVEIGVQETDCDGFRIRARDSGDGVAERSIVKRDCDVAGRIEALPYGEPELARYQRFRRRRAQIVAVTFEAFAHFDDIAVSCRGEQCSFRTLALQQSVGRDRRAVNDPIGGGK